MPENPVHMKPKAERIVEWINQVSLERRRRDAIAGLQPRVAAVKRYQQQRFRQTYSDLLRSERYGEATRFFLDDLYGPRDFSQRDAQFARVVPALVRLFPADLVQTVHTLAQLHALSEQLDSEMAIRLDTAEIDSPVYVRAWKSTGRRADRTLQIALILEVGAALDRYTRRPVLYRTLKLMRAPARAAGLRELQKFLESGFETFRGMGGAGEFLGIIESREGALVNELFSERPEA